MKLYTEEQIRNAMRADFVVDEEIDNLINKLTPIQLPSNDEITLLNEKWAKSREQTRKASIHIGFARGFECGLNYYLDYYEELDKTDLDEDEFNRKYIVERLEELEGGNND